MAVIFAHRQGFAECLADGLDAPYGILGRAMETAASSKPAKRHCPTDIGNRLPCFKTGPFRHGCHAQILLFRKPRLN